MCSEHILKTTNPCVQKSHTFTLKIIPVQKSLPSIWSIWQKPRTSIIPISGGREPESLRIQISFVGCVQWYIMLILYHPQRENKTMRGTLRQRSTRKFVYLPANGTGNLSHRAVSNAPQSVLVNRQKILKCTTSMVNLAYNGGAQKNVHIACIYFHSQNYNYEINYLRAKFARVISTTYLDRTSVVGYYVHDNYFSSSEVYLVISIIFYY